MKRSFEQTADNTSAFTRTEERIYAAQFKEMIANSAVGLFKEYEAAGRPSGYQEATFTAPTCRIAGIPTTGHGQSDFVIFSVKGEPSISLPLRPHVLPTNGHDLITSRFLFQAGIANGMQCYRSVHLGIAEPGTPWELRPEQALGLEIPRFTHVQRIRGLPMPEINSTKELLEHLLFEASLVLAAMKGKDIHEISSALFNYTRNEKMTQQNLTEILDWVLDKILQSIRTARHSKDSDHRTIYTSSCTRLATMGIENMGKSTLQDTVLAAIEDNSVDDISPLFQPVYADPYADTRELLLMLRYSPPPPRLVAWLRKSRGGEKLPTNSWSSFIGPWMFKTMGVPVTTGNLEHLLTSQPDIPFLLCDIGGFRIGHRPACMEYVACMLADGITLIHLKENEGDLYRPPEQLEFLRTHRDHPVVDPLRHTLWGRKIYHGTGRFEYLDCIGNAACDPKIQTITAEYIMRAWNAQSLKFERLNITFRKFIRHITAQHLKPRHEKTRKVHASLPASVIQGLINIEFALRGHADRSDPDYPKIEIAPHESTTVQLSNLLDTIMDTQTIPVD
ncbi:MAG: hypothetical protein U9Q67_00130 [Patescibacteria group bacterium]|nr:hypothetical protein [Patescibacteria group bacterium]